MLLPGSGNGKVYHALVSRPVYVYVEPRRSFVSHIVGVMLVGGFTIVSKPA